MDPCCRSTCCDQNLSHDLTKFSLLAILIVLVAEIAPAKSYGMDESGNVQWELVYVSADHGCTPYQYEVADQYDEVASKYLDLYKFPNSHYMPQCMSDARYPGYKAPADLDLLILVYDDQIARTELHPNDVGGFYTHMGQDRTKDHMIVVCDCSNFEFAAPTYTLSHEISHFITYYLGFGLDAQNQIHQLAARYDSCIEVKWNNSTCTSTMARVYGDTYFTWAAVMAPYQPAVGKGLVSDNSTSASQDSVASSEVAMDMQKEITKWWLDGTINDTQYEKILGYIVTKPDVVTDTNAMPANVLLASGRDGEEENSTYHDLGASQDGKTATLLKRIPFKLENSTLPGGMVPEWFKRMAGGWAYNQTLSNKDFVDSIRHMFETEGAR